MRTLLFFFVIAVIFFIGAATFAERDQAAVVFSDGFELVVEVADEPAERARGLSGREKLSEGEGMLFDFQGTEPAPGIWMKGMRFSIDILWMRDGEVVWIEENAPVPRGEEVASYLPPVEATHVLELPAGFVSEHEIFPGDVLVIAD